MTTDKLALDEAIVVLKLENKCPWNRDNSVLRKSVRLGIEGLEKQKQLREMAWLFTELKFSNIPDIIKKIKALLPSEAGGKE